MKRLLRFIWALTKYIFTGRAVDSNIYKIRLENCYSCKYLSNEVCSICGCYVKKKAKWTTEHCPKNKW